MIEHVNSELYNQDGIYKQIEIEYDSGVIANSDLHYERFEFEESLCAESILKFGSCEANKVTFRLRNPFASLVNKNITIKSILNKDTENPFILGFFKVYSDVPSADRSYRDITAYDSMYDIINSDVSDWYNGLFSGDATQMSLKQFRNAFISHFGLEEEETTLINDEMIVTKTIDGTGISGKMVISAICEINGCFGKIGRNGKFKYVYLPEKSAGLYPSNNLFPSSSLFTPEIDAKIISSRQYKGSPTYEDFNVQKITGIQIRMEEDDIGVSVGSSENVYVIEDNFLVYGMGEEALNSVASKILNKIDHISYRPFSVNTIGNPCVEVGDLIRVNTKTIQIDSYVLQRVLTGIQVMTDNYSANGEEKYSKEMNSLASEIQKLKGKSNVLKRTLEETISLIKDEETGLESQIKQQAKLISLKVSKGDISSELSLEEGTITLKGNRVVIDSDYFKVSEDGTIEAVNGRFSGDIECDGQITFFERNEENGNINTAVMRMASAIFEVKTEGFIQNEDGIYVLDEEDVTPTEHSVLLIDGGWGLDVGDVIGNNLQFNYLQSNIARVKDVLSENADICNLKVYNDMLLGDNSVKKLLNNLKDLRFETILKQDVTSSYESIRANGLRFDNSYVYPVTFPNSVFLIALNGNAGVGGGSLYIAMLGESADSASVSFTKLSRDLDYVHPVLKVSSSGYLYAAWSASKTGDIRANIFRLA